MLFHSQLFLLLFLPVVAVLYYAAAAHRRRRVWLLIVASFVFYGYWDVRLVPLLAGSIVVNWLIARYLGDRMAPWTVALGVAANLLVLGIFKYANFFVGAVAVAGGWEHERWSIVLPLAISFFTFQQISYLVDLAGGKAPKYRFDEYALYVCFFPQLIAGPIVRHNEIISQFGEDPRRPGFDKRLSRGLTLFACGLGKKVLFADQLARLADPVFATAVAGKAVGGTDAWVATAAYTFQLYFDFSGYSDMAVGLALIFGFSLPFNFNAPYQATSLRDFWRRWHMTLTRFMRDYVYVPLGLRLRRSLGRHGPDTIATLATMTLLGLWHGAAWSYVLFGAIHGAVLILNQLWRRLGGALPDLAGWALTMAFFSLSLVLFRSEDIGATANMLAVMFAGPMGVPTQFEPRHAALLAAAAACAMLGPTSQVLILERLTPRGVYAVAAGLVMVAALVVAAGPDSREFIYFQF